MSTVSVKFKCKQCGHGSIDLPDNPTEASIAKCAGCRAALGTWGAIKNASMETVKERVVEDFRKTLKNAFKNTPGMTFK